MANETFTDSLAWTDLEVYCHDMVHTTITKLAERWQWTEDRVIALCRAFMAKHDSAWHPADLTA